MFSQDHCAKVLLGWDTDTNHDAAYDAVKSVRLFNYYQQVGPGCIILSCSSLWLC